MPRAVVGPPLPGAPRRAPPHAPPPRGTVLIPLLLAAACSSPPSGPTVVLVVLDTVRVERLGACGAGRPTTPFLSSLVEDGARLSCRAYVPGSWTLPSHASYFTGVPVEQHGADYVSEQGARSPCASVDCGAASGDHRALFGDHEVAVLGESWTTLAEDFAAKGYTTLGFSENPVVSPVTGLMQGFQHTWSPRVWSPGNGPRAVEAAEAALEAADRAQPMFLFVNLAQSHDPFPAVPGGFGGEDLPALQLYGGDRVYERFLQGQMAPEEQARFLDLLRAHHDAGLERSDALLARLVASLHRWRSPASVRMAITTDHGENLGEFGLIGHGSYLREPTARGFVMLVGGDGALPADPVSTLGVHAWLQGGAYPSLPAAAVGRPSSSMQRRSRGRFGGDHTVVGWDGARKLALVNGRALAWDLDADPLEASPRPWEDPVWAPRLASTREADLANLQRATPMDAEARAMLEAAGYLEPATPPGPR